MAESIAGRRAGRGWSDGSGKEPFMPEEGASAWASYSLGVNQLGL